MNFFYSILTYRMDVITAIKTRWIKFIILNVEITICVPKKISKKELQKTGVKQTRTGALQHQRQDQVPWMLH